MIKLSKTYHKQNACINCKLCFIKKEYDQGDIYYCTYGAPKRPLCCSVQMDEAPDWFNAPKEEVAEVMRQWDEWSEGREVVAHGICNSYDSAP